jgi:hypothetical protein
MFKNESRKILSREKNFKVRGGYLFAGSEESSKDRNALDQL